MVLWVGWSHESSDATFDRTRNGRLRKLGPKNLSKKAKMSHRIEPECAVMRMNTMRMKVAHSGCSDPHQIQDGTDTCQGHKLRVHGTRSHNPRSIPAKCPCLRFVILYVGLFVVKSLFRCLFIESSHLRILRYQNNIVFIAIVVVNGDKPVALLHEEVWQPSDQLLKKTWLLTVI